jgi:hypothetical protein
MPDAQKPFKCEYAAFMSISFYRNFSKKEFIQMTHKAWRK